MENTNHDETLLARWLSDELTPDELADLQQLVPNSLREREDFADLQAIVEEMKGLEAPAFSEQASWEKLQEKLKSEPQKSAETETPTPVISEGEMPEADIPEVETPKIETAPPTAAPVVVPPVPAPAPKLEPVVETPVRSINRRQWLYAAAAALALLLVALLWLRDDDPSSGFDTIMATLPGEHKKVTLPDGSTAEMNALTTIAFTGGDWEDEREVYLKGEAFFRAKKGKTFTVITDQGKVRVVGTAFNVFVRHNELEVKCTEGKVQVVNSAGSEKVLIKKGEQVSVVNGKMQRRGGIDFTPKWFNGESVFKGAQRSRVFGEIERQFSVTVITNDLEGSPFSGKFVNDDLDKALKMISVPMGLKYEVRNDTVWFSPK